MGMDQKTELTVILLRLDLVNRLSKGPAAKACLFFLVRLSTRHFVKPLFKCKWC
ncbi:hypothetical protein ACLOJK_033596 [Asimina triloba]